MSWVAIGIAAVGIGTSLWGASKQAKAAKSAGKAEAKVHLFNAEMNMLNYSYIKRQTAEGQFIMSEESSKGMKSIRAKKGKRGITGISSFEVELEAARIYTRNKEIYRREGMVAAMKAARLATLDQMKAAASLKGGKFGAQAAWATGVTNAASFGASYFANRPQTTTAVTTVSSPRLGDSGVTGPHVP